MISPTAILQGGILIVDDQKPNVILLERMLRGAGYVALTSTMDPTAVGALHAEHQYDLILLDLQMPGMDGFQVMAELALASPDGYLPVLVITAQPGQKLRALEAGARDFLDSLRRRYQVMILSDTFYEFAAPLMEQLGHPTLFCHSLVVDGDDTVRDYRLRIQDGKRRAVMALKLLNFDVVAAGDSYNDTSMLAEAHAGILFCPPANVAAEFPQFPVTRDYDELRRAIVAASKA